MLIQKKSGNLLYDPRRLAFITVIKTFIKLILIRLIVIEKVEEYFIAYDHCKWQYFSKFILYRVVQKMLIPLWKHVYDTISISLHLFTISFNTFLKSLTRY